ncbi:MAG: N-acetylmuramoyl-L-alanine amidase [Chitinophagaceae bacterium]|nr:N-acetylmuramoyl-L-alanine amidase [Chitinophagaceae bacterium]
MNKKSILSFGGALAVFIFSAFTILPHKTVKNTLRTIIIDAGHGGPDHGAKGRYSDEATLNLQLALKLGKKLQEALPDCKIVYTRTDEYLPGNLNDKNVANRLRAKIANESKGDLFIAIHVNSMPDHYKRVREGYREETYYTYKGKGKKKKKVAHTRTVPNYVNVKIQETISGTETYIWATGKNESKKQFVRNESEEMGGSELADSDYKYFESPEAKIFASIKTKQYFENSKMVAQFVEDELSQSGRPTWGVKQRDYEGIWVLQATAMPSILVETGFICTPDDEDYLNSASGQEQITESIKKAVVKYKATLESKSENRLGLK